MTFQKADRLYTQSTKTFSQKFCQTVNMNFKIRHATEWVLGGMIRRATCFHVTSDTAQFRINHCLNHSEVGVPATRKLIVFAKLTYVKASENGLSPGKFQAKSEAKSSLGSLRLERAISRLWQLRSTLQSSTNTFQLFIQPSTREHKVACNGEVTFTTFS